MKLGPDLEDTEIKGTITKVAVICLPSLQQGLIWAAVPQHRTPPPSLSSDQAFTLFLLASPLLATFLSSYLPMPIALIDLHDFAHFQFLKFLYAFNFFVVIYFW